MNKRFLVGIAAITMMLVASVSQAAFVIDDFTSGTGLMKNGLGPNVVNNPNATGSVSSSGFDRTVTLGGTTSLNGGQPNIQGSIGGGTAKYSFQTVGTTLNAFYNNFGMFVLNTAGQTINTTLSQSVANTPRDYRVTVYGNSAAHGAVTASQVVTLGKVPTAFSFNTALFGNNAAAATLTSIGFQFERISGGTNNNVATQLVATGLSTTGNLVPVPEPASMVLLGLTGLAGVVYRRRRSQVVA